MFLFPDLSSWYDVQFGMENPNLHLKKCQILHPDQIIQENVFVEHFGNAFWEPLGTFGAFRGQFWDMFQIVGNTFGTCLGHLGDTCGRCRNRSKLHCESQRNHMKPISSQCSLTLSHDCRGVWGMGDLWTCLGGFWGCCGILLEKFKGHVWTKYTKSFKCLCSTVKFVW